MNEELFIVCNILVGDSSIDPEYGGSREDYFEVRYDQKSIRIPPGETRVLPLYLANHFAKHLTDYILAKEGVMMHDSLRRDVLIKQIILRNADESDQSYAGSDEGITGVEESTPDDTFLGSESDSEREGVDVPDSPEGDAPRGTEREANNDEKGSGKSPATMVNSKPKTK